MSERLKRAVRLVEAAVTPRRSSIAVAGRHLRFVKSMWWHDAHQAAFDDEIQPYFRTLPPGREYFTICDAGAAAGLFAVAACAQFPSARVHAFEPSGRQRIILRRNVQLNGFAERVDIVPLGLWDAHGTLEFRTHGAIGALRLVAGLPRTLEFGERVRVDALDAWASRAGVTGIDLIKMDIEGAEPEALAGAREILRRDRPELLVQAYHVRDGARTFERCAMLLEDLGYTTREAPAYTGLLHAIPA
jgi:FkbM family methyltransferase